MLKFLLAPDTSSAVSTGETNLDNERLADLPPHASCGAS
jgi:hypothetical protein